jgi:hypothetical protein
MLQPPATDPHPTSVLMRRQLSAALLLNLTSWL